MKPSKHERRTLLEVKKANNGHVYNRAEAHCNSSDEDEDNNAASSDNDNIELITSNGNSSKLKSRTFSTLSNKHNRGNFRIHRCVRRIVRIFIYVLLLSMLLLLLFSLPFYPNLPSRHMPLADWSYNTSRNIADYVLPDNDTTIMQPQNVCDDKVFLVIIVCSSIHNFNARQTIRETWGNTTKFKYDMFSQLHAHLNDQYLLPSRSRLQYYHSYLNPTNDTTTTTKIAPIIRILFLIGRNNYELHMGNEAIARIRNEAQQFNDIIQENFYDSYNNLTLKTVLALKWFKRHCLKQVAFLMKCDDDTFVNLPNLIHYLLGGTIPIYNDTLNFYDINTSQPMLSKSRLSTTTDYLVGHLFCTSHPISDINSKWYMPYYIYPEDTYPKYLSGAGYLMTADCVPRLYNTALNTTFIHLEDVYLTGIVAARAGLKPNHHPLFGYTRAKEWCSFKGTITQHDMKDDSLMEAYAFVTNISHHCPPPGKYFKRIRLRKPHACA